MGCYVQVIRVLALMGQSEVTFQKDVDFTDLPCITVFVFFFFVASSGFSYLCWPVAAHFAPMDTHAIGYKAITTTYGAQTWGPFPAFAPLSS